MRAANKKPPEFGGLAIADLTSDHMMKGRRPFESGTSSKPVRAHVQNCVAAVNGAVLRITINGAPLFDCVMMPERVVARQGICRDFSTGAPVSLGPLGT